MSQETGLLLELKQALRAQRLHYRDVARALRLSEASVKRLFSRGGFTLERLERCAELAGVTLSDLVERMQRRAGEPARLTRAQEQEVVRDPKLFLLTWLLVNRWSVVAISATFQFGDVELQRLLIRLDRLRIIELQPGNRSRLLVNTNLVWQPGGPIMRHMQQVLLREYLQSDFSHRYAEIRFFGTTLSEGAMVRVQKLVQNCQRDCMEIAASDARLPQSQRYGSALLLAFRPWQYSGFSRYLRKEPKPAP
ncbi:MAG: XRE family transcriptional regulator [Steroidobacteraceae bacterium]